MYAHNFLRGTRKDKGNPTSETPLWDAPHGAFWVLKDISFSVKRGEVLGLIGRNGAGKTTLLKILSRITQPTIGQAVIHGRVGSLLEVGTGFHDELSGRENIYLNGTILGMKRPEIDRNLDEIIAFSGVERFIDTPVKYYSSGMRVRLAFSVAAHLDPEILLVDEVLAVGDVAFQEKCLKKMDNLTQEQGRTVLFVSHNMSAIANLCHRSILLESGQIAASGESGGIIARYYDSVRTDDGTADLLAIDDRQGSGILRFSKFYLEDLNGNTCEAVKAGDPVRLVLEYTYKLNKKPNDVWVHVVFQNSRGQRLFACTSDVTGDRLVSLSASGRFICTIPSLPLIPGSYDVQLSCLIDRELVDKVPYASTVSVVEGNFFGTGRLPISHYGDIIIKHHWSLD
jgi:lipopolysaccharide transport system ATP-binding protein